MKSCGVQNQKLIDIPATLVVGLIEGKSRSPMSAKFLFTEKSPGLVLKYFLESKVFGVAMTWLVTAYM